MSEQKTTPIGYIGLGNMGGPMALRLRKAGYPLHVFGRNKARLTDVLSIGAVDCATPADLAKASEIVFLCLTDTGAVEKVVFGEDGIVHGARPGSILIDCSTISPDTSVDMASRLEAQTGMRWLDSPVSGGTVGATNGTLSLFVGGRAEDLESASPVLSHIANNVTHMGGVGAGQTTKAINQIIISCSVAMLTEACGLAERAGLDTRLIPDALRGGRGDSVALHAYWQRIADRDYTSLSTVTSILKDIDIVQALARKVGAPLPLTGVVREYNQTLASLGHASEDLTALARLISPTR